LQFSDGLKAHFAVRNTAEAGGATGFSPQITVTTWPYGEEVVSGPLVFAGRSRTVEYSKIGSYLGVVATTVKTGNSERVVYSFAVTGYWRVLLPFALIVIGTMAWLVRYVKKHPINRGKSTNKRD
jgi:hypothetical protein